jgi:hypothetical protein
MERRLRRRRSGIERRVVSQTTLPDDRRLVTRRGADRRVTDRRAPAGDAEGRSIES